MPRKLDGSYIQTGSITTTQLSSAVTQVIEAGGGPRVTSLVYPGNDTAANTAGGQTVYINGSGFETNNAIYINGNAVPSKSFISASNISFTTPALAAGIYPVYVINTDTGATAIFVPGYISSGEPSWVSTASIEASETWSIALSATGDAPITYALAGGSSLPGGISLAANGLISGTLSSPPLNDTQYTFTVIASDAQNQDASRQFTVTVSTGEGVLFANNVLLIHADGTNNQNNHHFIDSSSNNYTITRNGNPTQGSFSPFSQTGWSNYFDGNGDFLDLGYNSNFTFGSGNFTIECWVYTQATGTIAGIWDDSSTDPQSWIISSANRGSTTAANINFVIDVSGTDTLMMTALQPMNKWFHLAITRSGSSWYMFMDGSQVATTTSSATISAGNGSRGLNLGAYNGANQSHKWGMNGYISNFRIIKGSALYTSAFTPATSALTAVSGTTLLTCQSNRFIDNSNNAYSITRNGDVSVQVFSPFAPSASYTTANVGGSVYMDGTGDYLNAPSSIWTSLAGVDTSFTVEAWIYPTGVSAQASEIIGINQSGQTSALSFRLTTGYALSFANWGSGYTSTTSSDGVVKPYSWNHVAASKSGSSMKLFVNGVVVATQTISNGTINSFSKQLEIGGRSDDNATKFIGYMSGLRVVQGEALYTANTSPPTIPPTNVANTSLLCNFTNAGIFDQTAKNVLETVGDAKVSTAQYKYGTASMYFDGTGDYITAPNSDLLHLGSGNFTIEFWVYFSAFADGKAVLTKGWSSINAPFLFYTDGVANSFKFYSSSNGSGWDIANGIAVINSPSTNTWYHVAVIRDGTSIKTFSNGTQTSNVTSSATLYSTTQPVTIGAGAGGSNGFNGYIDDLRITKGYARYTSNFTPPASAFKDK